MVIAYEDYPWKNPLRIYWASVTGSRKVSSSQPTLFQQAHDPTLLVSIIDGPSFLRTIWDRWALNLGSWSGVSRTGRVGLERFSSLLVLMILKKHSSPLKTPLTPEFISSLFSNVPSFQNSKIRKFKKIIFYKLRKFKTLKNSKSSNLAKSKWFVVRIDNWNFSVRVHDSNHSHFITLEWNYKHLKSILNSEQFQV